MVAYRHGFTMETDEQITFIKPRGDNIPALLINSGKNTLELDPLDHNIPVHEGLDRVDDFIRAYLQLTAEISAKQLQDRPPNIRLSTKSLTQIVGLLLGLRSFQVQGIPDAIDLYSSEKCYRI